MHIKNNILAFGLFLSLMAPSHAAGQINVLRHGLFTDDLDLVYCNLNSSDATIEAKTSGDFLSGTNRLIGANKCGVFVFSTSEPIAVFHVRAGDSVKVLSYEKKPGNIFASEAFKNFLFLLLGAALVGIQDILKYVFIGPATAAKLWLMYKANVKAFRRAKDDIAKIFAISDPLLELDTKPTAETSFVTEGLALRIRNLVELHKTWKTERPLSAATREKIDRL